MGYTPMAKYKEAYAPSPLVFVSGDYGIPRPWYFPLQQSYWLGPGCPEAEKTATADGELCGKMEKLVLRNNFRTIDPFRGECTPAFITAAIEKIRR